MAAFWGEEKPELNQMPLLSSKLLLPAVGLSVLVIGMGLGSEAVYGWVSVSGDTLLHPSTYIDAVLKE